MFFDRERELGKLLKMVSYDPNMITFIYGPINSGKTVLMSELTKRIAKDFTVFYINLRGRFVNSYEDFMKVLFSVREGSPKELLAELLKSGLAYGGIPVPEGVFKKILENKDEDPFVFLENYLRELKEKGRKPILIIDELQVVSDLKIDGLLIYKLFNFFVRLTKETRLSHVFVVTSDSLFIEKVYNEAMLQGRADYFLVDDFERETALKFLVSQGFTNDEAELVWSYFGGKPVYLVEALKHREELKEWCEGTLEDRTSWLVLSLNSMRRKNPELFRDILPLLNEFNDKEAIKCNEIDDAVFWTVKNNVLFFDPRKRLLRPQGRLELLAIRRALDEVG
ncbi:ATP-binding protein [Pyrococcus kukulkanii]|uniref:ATP-binding protein n=1 Tax=Pyrococcus kukulkanii TaxID=1609559 RepID=UPI000F27F0BC|nr:MAG: ATP-binding protein [Thermococci archaeon]